MNDEILIKFLLNESSAEEQVEVHNWLNQNDENRSYFSGLQKIWVESKALGTVANRDVDLAWDKFKASTSASEVKTLKLKPRNVWMRVAAALVFALGSWLLYTMFDGGGYTDLNADNQVFSQLLPDGSELTLNKRSHLKFANNFKDNRSVQLDSGDVFFSVKSDKEKPFRVQIDQMMVEVVGTSFNIKHLKQETEVVVESGIVKVSLGSDEVLLHKGEKLVIGESNLKLKVEKADNQLYTYYRSGLFVADNTPLPVLVAILNEAYGTNVKVEGRARLLPISTTLLYSKSLDENLKTIQDTFDNLKIRRNQNEIIVSY